MARVAKDFLSLAVEQFSNSSLPLNALLCSKKRLWRGWPALSFVSFSLDLVLLSTTASRVQLHTQPWAHLPTDLIGVLTVPNPGASTLTGYFLKEETDNHCLEKHLFHTDIKECQSPQDVHPALLFSTESSLLSNCSFRHIYNKTISTCTPRCRMAVKSARGCH